ncbi:hypothetical protein BpHYR1_010033 [Brachionus plicatilis]|uniref:Uncharacterized protein n=1 Tax=Brachionus plicatilis TaxID=10195 RepID=A0A3M7RM95_BRAPC|nr:hypothetical protein BpHYR1_010033 [Brachionus plicatilis]
MKHKTKETITMDIVKFFGLILCKGFDKFLLSFVSEHRIKENMTKVEFEQNLKQLRKYSRKIILKYCD